jgi:hypothetical protein
LTDAQVVLSDRQVQEGMATKIEEGVRIWYQAMDSLNQEREFLKLEVDHARILEAEFRRDGHEIWLTIQIRTHGKGLTTYGFTQEQWETLFQTAKASQPNQLKGLVVHLYIGYPQQLRGSCGFSICSDLNF